MLVYTDVFVSGYFHTWAVNISGVLKQKCFMDVTVKMNICKHDNTTVYFRNLFVCLIM